MDARDFYFHQPVLEGEMDSVFADVESADLNNQVDKGEFGILHGFTAGPDGGGPSMHIQFSAGAAVDKKGHRLFSSGTLLQDITNDTAGVSTAPAVGNRRWVSIFARFGRDLSDPRTDGLGNPLFFKHAEALNSGDGTGTASPTGDVQANVGKLYVLSGGQDLITNPLPARPAVSTNAILLCDVLFTDGDTSFDIGKISTARAERYSLHFLAKLADPAEYDGSDGDGLNLALIFEATGNAGAFNRVYMSNNGLVFTQNAKWDPYVREWLPDTSDAMSKIHLNGNGIKMFRIAIGSGTPDTVPWDAEFDLSIFGTGGQAMILSSNGDFEQNGTSHAFWGTDFHTNDGGLGRGGAFTYNIPFTAPPSSVTMATVGSDLNIFSSAVTGVNEYGGKMNITLNADNTLTHAYRLITATF